MKADHDKNKSGRALRARMVAAGYDHEVINFRGRLIPVLGTMGGTPEESRQTADNIERWLNHQKEKGNKCTPT